MKALRPAVMIIFTACVLFFGISLLGAFLEETAMLQMPYDLVATTRFFVRSPWNWRMGLFLCALGVAIILMKLREVRKMQCIAFDNPEGEVAISMDAVEEFIREVGSEFPGVKSLIPTIHGGSEGIGVVIRMDIWGGSSVPRLSEEMQNAIKERVQNILGINVSYVSVNVGKIAGGDVEYVEEE